MPMRPTAAGIYVYIPSHVPAKDMAGWRCGKLTVTERAPSLAWGSAWRWRCDCGEEGVSGGSELRRRAKAQRRFEVACPACVKRERSERASRRNRERGRDCAAEREQRRQKREASPVCRKCFGLPHRRPESGCSGCGGEFLAEECA